MAGYAALISLKQTIEHLLESSRISLVPPSAEVIRLAYAEVEAFQKLLRRLDDCSPCKSRKKVNALDGRMKEAVWKFEDLLESHLVDQIILESADQVLSVSIDLQGLQSDVDSFVEALKDMQKEYIYELENMPQIEEDEYGSSRFDFGEIKSEMVGLSPKFEEVRHFLTGESPTPCVSLIGIAGIGKTALAKKLFEDDVISTSFEHRVWVTVGRRSQFNEVARGILAQVDPNMNQIPRGDKEIGEYLRKMLESKRSCIVVLDDVWDEHLLDSLVSYLPSGNNGETRILVTTRLRFMATLFSAKPYIVEQWMRRLYTDESKELLGRNVFGEEDFPPQLEKAAWKIALNCAGLPLMVLAVAHHLSKAKNNDPHYWNEVANKQSSAFMEAYNQVSKVLFPTYDFLPQNVKMFCLYVGGFPPDYEIHLSKLNNLWSAERLITQRHNLKSLYEGGNAINFGERNKILRNEYSNLNHTHIKTCRVYSWWWHMFNREASREKFLGVLRGGLEEGLKEERRRLCLHNNLLFRLQNMYNSVKCDCASTVRSLLCFGPYHAYSMPLDVGFKLLRVLDALQVRFYNFPIEIMELVLLQYLALTYNGTLPSSISKLLHLQFLIIHPHVSIKSRGAPSYMPVQIWDMQELKHIEILGRNLPNPNCASTLLKLSTLLGVSPNSCTREVLKKLPNIRKLGIRVELTPHDDDHSYVLSCFDHVLELKNLENLKFCIVNPDATPLIPLLAFPSRLRKLLLSGLGYPWEYMNVIGSLPNLEALKLQCHAFRGPNWETGNSSFDRLKYLLIEDTDLVQWKSEFGSFSSLVKLRLKNCYKLQELNWVSDTICGQIELVDCNPLAVTCAQQLQRSLQNMICLDVYASFDGDELMDGF